MKDRCKHIIYSYGITTRRHIKRNDPVVGFGVWLWVEMI